MSKYLVDTDVLIDMLRGDDCTIEFFDSLHDKGESIFYSPVTRAEIFHGIKSGEENEVYTLFQSMECMPVTAEIGELAGLYMKSFQRSHGIHLADSLIAATAKTLGSTLLTFNRRHYPMTDVKVVAPA